MKVIINGRPSPEALKNFAKVLNDIVVKEMLKDENKKKELQNK